MKSKHYLCILLTSALVPVMQGVGADVAQETRIFKTMIEENIPGTKYERKRYLAYYDEYDYDGRGDIRKDYRGADSNVRISVTTNKDGVIFYVNIQVDDVIYLNLLPILEATYGEFHSRKSGGGGSSGITALASLRGVQLRPFDSGTYVYRKRGIEAELDYYEAAKSTDGEQLGGPTTTYSATYGRN